MSLVSTMSCPVKGSDSHVPSRGLATACIAPIVIYVFIYGQIIHLVYLFVGILVTRVFLNIDLLSQMKPEVLSRSASSSSPQLTFVPIRHSVSRPSVTPTRHAHHRQNGTANSRTTDIKVPPATCIKSADCALTKIRRGIVNKVSPDKLDELTEKMSSTFNPYGIQETLLKDMEEFLTLVFAAASRQPQYVGVFTEFMKRICFALLDPCLAEDALVKQAQVHWSTVCLSSVEKTKGWDLLSEDDQNDARGRHRSKQLAIAELCGLMASEGLIPPAYPLTWIEALLRPIQTSLTSCNHTQASSSESAMEIICCTIRGLGVCEAMETFTDIDQSRFALLCDSLTSLPTISSRSKCILQDLTDLRNSGWSKSPNWKLDLVPRKRASM